MLWKTEVKIWQWSRYPFLFGLIGYLTGGLLSNFYQIELHYFLILATIFLISFIYLYKTLGSYFYKPQILTSVIVMLFISLGWYQFSNPISNSTKSKIERLLASSKGKIVIQGLIKSIDVENGRSKLEIDIHKLRSQETAISISSKTFVYTKLKTDQLKILDEIVVFVNVFPSVKINPYAFDYAALLRTKGIFFTGFASPNSEIKIVGNKSAQISYLPFRLKNQVSIVLHKYIKNEQTLAMYEAMSIGDRSKLDQSVVDVFSHTGAIHVLAVSGLHVGIIMQLTLIILGLIKIRSKHWKYYKIAIAISLSFFYAILVGATPSILRASMMFSVLLIGRQFQQYSNIYNILSLIALLILVHDPLIVTTLSFQFSFTAILSIAIYNEHIKKLWMPPNKYIGMIWDVIVISVAVQILMTPFIIYYFHTFPTYFFLNGLFAIPLVYTTLIGTISLLIVNTISASLAFFIANPFSKLTELFYYLLSKLDQLPLNIIENLYISKVELVLIFLAISLITSYFFSKKTKYLYSCNCIILLMIFLNFTRASSQFKNKEITVYDTKLGVLVDVFYGRNNLTFHSELLTKNEINFASNNNRLHKGASTQVAFNPSKNSQNHGILIKDNIVYIGSQKVYIPDSTLFLSKAMRADVILLNKRIKVNYKDKSKLNNKTIVLPRYLSPKQTKFFITYFAGNKIHDIKSDGYYHLDLSKSH